MRIPMRIGLVLLAVLLLLAPATAQRTRTWNPVHHTVRYEYRLYNTGRRPARDVLVHVPLPHQDARQELRYLQLSKPGFQAELTDVHGQRHARYEFAEIPPGGFIEASFVAGATLRNLSWVDPGRPERPGGPTLSPEERDRYLGPASNYSMESALLGETAARLVEGAASEIEKVERIHDFIIEKVRYVRDGKWDPAEQVLIQGHGSCSEYNYLLSGLCRLAGLPTRYVGGSSRRPGPLPVTDVVYHRWTEVFLEGVGWFPVDCSRDGNPLRGKRSHFGRVHSDMLVWCRQGGGGEDLLGWEYRAQAQVAGAEPRLRADHRTRWFEYIKPEELARARAWLAQGSGAAPGGDALECALLDWDQAQPAARIRLVQALAEAGRNECLRRAAGLVSGTGKQDDLYDRLCACPELAETLRDQAREPDRLRAWFRREEANLVPAGEGRFRLVKKERAGDAPTSGDQTPLWAGMAEEALADLDRELARCSPGPLLLGPIEDRTGGEGRGFQALQAKLVERLAAGLGRALVDPQAVARHLRENGPGPGEFWALAIPECEPPGGGLPEGLRPALVLIPVALVEPVQGKPGERRLQFELRVLDLPRAHWFLCGGSRLYRIAGDEAP